MSNQINWLDEVTMDSFNEEYLIQEELVKERLLDIQNKLLEIAGKTDLSDQTNLVANSVAIFNLLHNTSLTEIQGWSFLEIYSLVQKYEGKC